MVLIGLDVGGTFTDMVKVDEEGRISIIKSDTTPENMVEGILQCIKKSGIELSSIERFSYGTTFATNTIIQRKGAKTGLITTEGFEDILEIQRGDRIHNYDLQWIKPAPLVPRHLRKGVPERIDSKGRVIKKLDRRRLLKLVRELADNGVESIAVCFLFSYLNPAHEREAKKLIQEKFNALEVSISSELLREFREYERMSTVVLDAYIKPLMKKHLDEISLNLRGVPLAMVLSNGGSVNFDMAERNLVATVNSGPASGVVASCYWGALIGRNNLVSFDMGGTSCDVSLIRGGVAGFRFDYEIEWGIPIRVPMVDVYSIGAGGGSIAYVDKGGLLKVGPQSAGSRPGPACYNLGGENPTVTDANLIVGYLNPDYFLGGEKKLKKELSEKAIEKIADRLNLDPIKAASGILTVVNSNMEQAIRKITIERGHDPREFALLAFGGAGPLHAAFVAKNMGIREVIIPPFPGAFSAFGTILTDIKFDFVRSFLKELDRTNPREIDGVFDEMIKDGLSMAKRLSEKKPEIHKSLDMRYKYQAFEINVPLPEEPVNLLGREGIRQLFFKEYKRLYGAFESEEPCEIINLRLSLIFKEKKPDIKIEIKEDGSLDDALKGTREAYFVEGGWLECSIFERDNIPRGAIINGPSIIEEMESTIVIPPGDMAEVDSRGNVIIRIQ
jgi:N-methylhydantoinase A